MLGTRVGIALMQDTFFILRTIPVVLANANVIQNSHEEAWITTLLPNTKPTELVSSFNYLL